MDTPVRVKVCCIASIAEARAAIAAGASAIGLVSHMPSGPGVIEEARIAEVVAAVRGVIATFLLTSLVDVDALVAQHARCARPGTLQLCDRLPAGGLVALRQALPGVALVQVIHVEGSAAVDEACAVAPQVDAILLDSGRPGAALKELGGTGRVHDWSVSAALRDAVKPVPVWLAGGLRAENVGDAIRRVRPHGVDICTGVRTDGRLDVEKLARFVRSVAAATTP
ncbi:MAG: phosphoribosylanthranilate isomerase [Actinobacteria bacterium]|nr:phosphoribosylanthranilate isomerase [Actinomycetota bacterium]